MIIGHTEAWENLLKRMRRYIFVIQIFVSVTTVSCNALLQISKCLSFKIRICSCLGLLFRLLVEYREGGGGGGGLQLQETR